MNNVKTVAVMKNLKNPSYDSILFTFATFAQEIGRMPTVNQLPDLDFQFVVAGTQKLQKAPITKLVVEKHFGSLDRLKAAAREYYPELFEHVVDSKFYMPKKMETLAHALSKTGRKGKKTIIVTSVNAGMPTFQNGLKSLKTMCRFLDAVLVVIPTNGDLDQVDQRLVQDQDVHVLYNDLRLNNAISLTPVQVSATTSDPLGRMKKLVRRNNCSLVVGSPKLTFDSVACAAGRKADNLMSTGSISYPKYAKKDDAIGHLKIGNQVAEDEHFYSAIIIELNGQNTYYPRPVLIEPSTGRARDLSIVYHADGRVTRESPKVQVYGDIHSYQKNVAAFNSAVKLAGLLNIEEGVAHDFADAFTASSHKFGKLAENTAKAIAGMNNVGEEIDVLVKDINTLTEIHKKLHIISSNHDDMFSRNLESGDLMIGDPTNNIYGAAVFPYLVAYHLIHVCHVKDPVKVMAKHMHIAESVLLTRYPKIEEGITPLEALVDMNAPKHRERVRFLDIDDTLKVGRTDLSDHGHKGANASAKIALGSFVRGHAHTISIHNGANTVGHLSHDFHSYNRGGFGSWGNSVAHTYADGATQMVIMIDNEYTNFDLPKMFAKIGKGIKV
jgi:hypothetical protein